MTVVVQGFRETSRAFRTVNKNFPRQMGKELRLAAKPVEVDAGRLSMIEMSRIRPAWSQMRTGGGLQVVWVAPKARGRGAGNPRRKVANRKFADRLLDRAMIPALERNREKVVRNVDRALENVISDWGRGG